MPGWMKHKLESRLWGEISITSDMQMTSPLWQKAKKNKEPLGESKRREWKIWLKTQHSKNKDHVAFPLLGIHTKETRIEREMRTPMFTAALFIIARTWKQPNCLSADKWIRKLWYIYTMEYYSAILKNPFESVPMRWIKLEPIIQSEVSQKEKHQYSILMHIYEI